MKNICIIGAGLGGLACAIRLQSSGFNVTLIEKNQHPGGKMMPVKLGEYRFDFGPNTITMPWVFEDALKNTGFDLKDYLTFIRLERHTKNIFPDGTEFIQSVHPDEVIKQLKTLDPYAALHYWDYLKEIERLYKLSEKAFFPKAITSLSDFLDPAMANAFMRVRPFEKMWRFNQKYFSNSNIQNVFNRYATYIGSSPYQSPATFSMIGYLEMVSGVFTVKGGNTKIAEAFEDVFKRLGGNISYNEEVMEILIKNNKAYALQTQNGKMHHFDQVVVNGDYVTSTKNLIKESDRPGLSNQKLDHFEPSISAFVILVGLKTFQDNIHHHQVYFPVDYRKEFEDIFVHKKMPEDPTIYISHSAYTDKNISKGSNLFILVNAPANHIENVDSYKEKIYRTLEAKGIPITEQLEAEKVFTPDSLKHLFHAYKGSIYGISSNSMKDAFLRPGNKSTIINNLYYTGGSTHPGGGSPMVVMSGLNVADSIIKAGTSFRSE
ncbi:phytoene desaturase family protein [Jeotgalibacillus salarius]|uniref:4,4'-diaponeurosporene oxygenase n=1 Tax=Jeotgalibacillus salarius TaxID=546023 RepID=A0A4Y8LKR1_9BACL|nr:phytoene desaturase family protein [Jeotgalibacillus salarius]TFE02999.1 phytoene desaturase [Jeotgalibacillus salarius]